PRQPRLPEADRPESSRPLASALLKELRLQRALADKVENKAAATSKSALLDEQEELTENSQHDNKNNENRESSSSEKEEKLSSENWLDDDFIDANFIENALGLSDEEISFIDKTPLPFERLSGADELNSQA